MRARVEVGVVIVSYNTCPLLTDCLESVLATTADLDSEIVVVDNASADGSAAMVAERFAGVRVLALADNVGFAAACNLGADHIHARHLLLLNPDTVVRPGAVQALLAALSRRPAAGLVGGRTLAPDGSLDPRSCWGTPTPWSLLCFGLGLSTAFARSRMFDPESLGRWPRDTEREVGVVTGCLLLVRADVWRRLGGMDPAYFVYGEDVDFSVRARRLGYRPFVTPLAEVVHLVGASSETSASKKIMVLRGKATQMQRLWGPAAARFGLAMLVLGVALRATGAALRRRRHSVWTLMWQRRQEWIGGWAAVPDLPREPVALPALGSAL